MTTTSASQSGQSRFSRLGFSLGLKSQPELRNRPSNPGKGREDDDWYIPYTGTYEPPPESRSSRNRERDSWGDPIFNLSNTVPSGDGPHVHYDDDSRDRYGMVPSEDNRLRGRGQVRSISSNYTASTGMDYGKMAQGAQGQYRTVSSHRQHTPSYIALDRGGVGESPAPQHRQSKDQPLSHRGSLASIFTFGVKPPTSPLPGDNTTKLPPRKSQGRPSTSSGVVRSVGLLPADSHRRTASGSSNTHSIRTRYGAKNQLQSIDSRTTTTDEDYYNSYYSTLRQSTVKPRLSGSVDPLSPSDSPSTQTDSSPHHPYALALRRNGASNGKEVSPTQPRSAPPTSLAHQPPLVVPKLTFSVSHPVQPTDSIPALPAPGPNIITQKQIKGSVSTPNLKVAKNSTGATRHGPRGIDRWLSAETWCDALIFPRPRFKIHNDGASNGRIVSPPASPVLSEHGPGRQMESVPSRVLAHSRSLVNLREAREEELQRERSQGKDILASPPTTTEAQSQPQVQATGQMDTNQRLRPPRPKSWASDDLDIPSPVPSLAKVLAEGEKLEADRREWQSKAIGSWGNKHARSVSRSRSKSLTAKGRKATTQTQSRVDFLAARAVHGSQDIIPVLPPSVRHKKAPSQGTQSHSTHSRNVSNSQTHTGSIIRTLTRSSKSHSRDHSRNDHSTKPGIKPVRPSTAPNNDATTSYMDGRNAPQHPHASESTPHMNEDGVSRRAAQTSANVAPSLSFPLPLGPSPTPSGASGVTDPRVGIAISTPLTDESLDRDNLRMVSHPYAQGGLSYNVAPTTREKHGEYVGPHPIQSLRPIEVPLGPAARHKLPPHITLSHPYAHGESPKSDSFQEPLIRHPHPDSDIPAHAKMWAPLAPGVVQEVLPVDLTYSPMIDSGVELEGDVVMAMAMTGITDTVGVGEALAYAAEYRQKEGESARDSGLGTSENIHGSWSGEAVEVGAGERGDSLMGLGSPSRMPIQYDVTRTAYRPQHQHLLTSPETAHTFASTPLEHQYTPRIPQFVRAEMAALSSPTAIDSETSSPRNSPRPLGSPNDLVGFQDLFYKPSTGMNNEPRRMASFGNHSLSGSLTRLSNIPFDLKSSYQPPASSLTNLARKLSQEYEQLSSRERSDSQYSQSGSSGAVGSLRSPTARQPTDASLEFVFEEMIPTQSAYSPERGDAGSSLPFGPQENVPEDVHSMTSMDTGKELESEDETVLHVKQVEKATPSATDADHRLSLSGQMGYHSDPREGIFPPPTASAAAISNDTESVDLDGQHSVVSSPRSETRVLSGLQAPLSDNTRSSYITTSTMSRMSGLSDFPIPPMNHRMSLLSAYFNEITTRPSLSIGEDESSEPLPSRPPNSNNRLTFGAGADAEEIVEALSNHPKRF